MVISCLRIWGLGIWSSCCWGLCLQYCVCRSTSREPRLPCIQTRRLCSNLWWWTPVCPTALVIWGFPYNGSLWAMIWWFPTTRWAPPNNGHLTWSSRMQKINNCSKLSRWSWMAIRSSSLQLQSESSRKVPRINIRRCLPQPNNH